MKTSASLLNPEDLALTLGATVVRDDGSVFNSSGRVAPIRLPRSAPKPEAAPAPSGRDDLTAALAEMLSKLQSPAAPVVTVPPAQVVVSPQPRTAWDFVFTRNQDGTIKSIRATPVAL